MGGLAVYLWVALGGALGSVARFAFGNAAVLWWGSSFPWGTLVINIVGSFVISCFGTLAAANGRFPLPAEARLFVTVGVCGGFTTFSSFSLQTVELLRAGVPLRAGLYAGASLGLCIAACGLGLLAAQALGARQG